MALLVAEYDALMEAKSQNEWLMEQLRLLKKKQSGSVKDAVPDNIPDLTGMLISDIVLQLLSYVA